ncbi:MAG: recombination mediator RecR [Thermodesulfobacteriota bacterium]|nr:recombination mediator RecR [Thermodesulfobacteriota bacterium]
MDPYPRALRDLINQMKRLPGIGEKSATRLAMYILGDKGDLSVALARSLDRVRKDIRLCPVCFNLTDQSLCPICSDPSRDPSIICVVEDPGDVLALESAHEYKGVYHCLHGLISPINGIGPEDIKLSGLIKRVKDPGAKEVIVATNPSVEGESTFHYISRMIKDASPGTTVSRIASGVPMGGELRYMDQVTLASALRYRRNLQ